MIPDGVEPSFPACRAAVVPFDHGIVEWPKSESNRQNHQPLELAALPVCVFGRKWQVQESHLAGEGYEPSLGTGPPASNWFQLQAPESNRGDRPYESQLGASRACIASRVTKGRVELPSPHGHDVLSVACLPVAPLGQLFRMTRAGIEPAFAA